MLILEEIEEIAKLTNLILKTLNSAINFYISQILKNVKFCKFN